MSEAIIKGYEAGAIIGGGMSFTGKLELMKMLLEGKETIVVDPEHEYTKIVELAKENGYKINVVDSAYEDDRK